MPPIMYSIAGGIFFLPGTVVLVTAVLIGAMSHRRWLAILGLVLALLGIAMIATSATALPWRFYLVWSFAMIAWLPGRRFKRIARGVLLLCTVAAAGWESWQQIFRPLPPDDFQQLYVVGDSITAGLDRRDETTWPAIIQSQHAVEIENLSRAGCTISQANTLARSHPPSNSVVLIEIGGNDMIGRTASEKFGDDLNQLIETVNHPGCELVMFELPLFPFDNSYGLQQRQIAAKFNVHLIPRRLFAAILASRDATTDGIHLTRLGQQQLAALVWKMVGPAFSGHSHADQATGKR